MLHRMKILEWKNSFVGGRVNKTFYYFNWLINLNLTFGNHNANLGKNLRAIFGENFPQNLVLKIVEDNKPNNASMGFQLKKHFWFCESIWLVNTQQYELSYEEITWITNIIFQIIADVRKWLNKLWFTWNMFFALSFRNSRR